MRRALNENPILQVFLIGALVLVVGFLFLTRIASEDDSNGAAPAPSADATVAPVSGTPSTTEPSTTEPTTTVPAATASEFAAGPGLPNPVVAAYDRGETVVLLVVRRGGIDDGKVEATVRKQAGAQNTALFLTRANGIARYSRITHGVDVDRVPALIVIKPKRLSDGPLPEATVSYGYRGPQSVTQAVRDATYRGREDIPTYPE